jgi:hypothetical protein
LARSDRRDRRERPAAGDPDTADANGPAQCRLDSLTAAARAEGIEVQRSQVLALRDGSTIPCRDSYGGEIITALATMRLALLGLRCGSQQR